MVMTGVVVAPACGGAMKGLRQRLYSGIDFFSYICHQTSFVKFFLKSGASQGFKISCFGIFLGGIGGCSCGGRLVLIV
nr:hypothetical protein CFP56_50585 [Quercus suber]